MEKRIPKELFKEVLDTLTTQERKHIKQLLPGYKYTYSSMRAHVHRLKIGVQAKHHKDLFEMFKHRISND